MPESVTQLSLTLFQSAFLDTREKASKVDDPADPSILATIARLEARYHFGGGWSADVALPIGSVRYDPGEDRQSLRLTGFGDLELAGRYDFSALWGAGGYNPSMTLRVGLGLPSGTQAELRAANVPPNLLSIGEATWSVSGRLTADQFLARWIAIGGWLETTIPLGHSQEGLRTGTRFGYGAGATFLPLTDLAVSLHAAGEHRTRSDELPEGTVLSSGGHSLAAQLWVGYRITERLNVGLGGRVPFYQRVGGTQITETFSAFASLSLTFGGHDHEEGHDHGHEGEHDHGDEHGHAHEEEHRPIRTSTTSAAPEAKLEDLATGGASFDLASAAVLGKVTVIDFWAEWCAPCKHIDALLSQLAAAHPDSLAVRRAEVPDFDSPVAKEHLSDVAALPVIWIFDREGTLVEKLVGVGPDEVRAKLQRYL